MRMRPVKAEPVDITNRQGRIARDAHVERPRRAAIEQHKGIGAKELDHIHCPVDLTAARGPGRDMLGPNTHLGGRARQGAGAAAPTGNGVVARVRGAGKNVHLGTADELRDEHVAGMVIKRAWRADLNDTAGVQHHDPVGQRHRFHLIVCDIDHRGIQRLVQLGDLVAHLDAQGGIKVRQRLVEQKRRRIAYDGPADGDPLALAARQVLGPPIKVRVQLQCVRSSVHLRVDFGLGCARSLERKAHVVAHRHVRIQRVGLKHHRQPALAGWLVRDVLPVDVQ